MSDALPTGWASTNLGEVVEILDSMRVPVNSEERNKRPGNIPYYGATGQVGTIDDYLFDEELILLGEDGAPFLESAKAKAYLIRGRAWVNNHAHVLRARAGVRSLFLLHQLNQVDYGKFVSGTTRLKLPQAPMRQIPIRLAPEREQGDIVAEIEKQFTRLDAAVAALKRVQANLKRYRAAVLKAACEGRLVPTEAELARKEGRTYETGEQLLARILKERRTKWESDQLVKMHTAGKPPNNDDWKKKYKGPEPPDDRDLPTLPKGWTWGSLGQIAEIQGGIQKQPSRTPRENAYPFLRVANVYRGRLDLSEIHRIEVFGDELSKLRLCVGDLLIVEGNGSPTEIGRMAIWKGEIENCVHQNHIIRARLNSGVLPAYCAAYWNSSLGSSEVARVAGSTSGLYTLSVGKVSKIAIPIPPPGEQERIANEMERVLTALAEVEPSALSNQRRADRLRQSILKRAFEGKLVPQDPNDEPVSMLLERIQIVRGSAPEKPKNRRRIAMLKDQEVTGLSRSK